MFLTPFTADAEDEKTQTFVKAYKDAFGDTPIQFAADAYDCVYTIKAAIEKSGVTPDKSVSDICDALKAAMTQIKMDCLTGKEITWSADGEPSKLPTAVSYTHLPVFCQQILCLKSMPWLILKWYLIQLQQM